MRQIPFIETINLSKTYNISGGWRQSEKVQAVDNVSFTMHDGCTFGIVGESGCGKSTFLRLLLCLEKPTSGSLLHRGQNLTALTDKQLHFYRRRVQAIFQDPASSLNQRFCVRDIILEPLINFGLVKKSQPETDKIIGRILEQVGLRYDDRRRFPHEFSGGQQRRIAIARAIAIKPDLIICDEATSGLDVSVQAQILNLLSDLREEFNINYLFVSHDLAAVRYLCPEIAVMYAGQVVELLSASSKEQNTVHHPYTKALLAGEPSFKNHNHPAVLYGEPPDATNYPPGCRFHPRCPNVTDICREVIPELTEIATGQRVACHLFTAAENSKVILKPEC